MASLTALIYILGLSTLVLFLLSRSARDNIGARAFRRWATLWILITSFAFLANNFWLFTLLVLLTLSIGLPRTPGHRIAAYIFLIAVVPTLIKDMPGIGGVVVTYPRILALIALVPLAFSPAFHNRPLLGFFSVPADKWIFLFCLITFVLGFRDTTLTNGLKTAYPIAFDILLPYYFVSRAVRTVEDFQRVFYAIFASAVVLATIGIFESTRWWLVYESLTSSLDTAMGHYPLSRGGFLRTQTVFYSPIVYGYYLVIGCAAVLFISPTFKSKLLHISWTFLVILALLSTVSRGPWVGGVVFYTSYLFLYGGLNSKYMPILKAFSIMLIVVLIALVSPVGEELREYLPFFDSEHSQTIDYRADLLSVGIKVVFENPVFGYSGNSWAYHPDMIIFWQEEHIREAFVDIVNTYLAIALEFGLVGLSFFVTFFMTLLWRVWLTTKRIQHQDLKIYRIGGVLVCCTISILATIITVGPGQHVELYYWIIGALLCAFSNLPKTLSAEKN